MHLFSHSRIGSFEQCPKAYEFKYIQEVEVYFDSVEQHMGRSVHSALEWAYQEREKRTPSAAEVKDAYRQAFYSGDDQLVHSDPHRMNWLSELMYRCADEFQILVFTCRPEEYELENQTARANWIDLEQSIQRTEELAPASG